MRRWRLMTVLVAAITVGVLGFTLIPAWPAGGSTERFRVCDQNGAGYENDIDVGEDGFSAGDQFVFTDKILYPQNGVKAGRDLGHATIIRPIGNSDAIFSINALFEFPDGKLSVYVGGRFSDFEEGTRFPITGGTGTFEGATGSVRIKNHPCDGKSGISFHFHVTT
jgi:hypothetical protein